MSHGGAMITEIDSATRLALFHQREAQLHAEARQYRLASGVPRGAPGGRLRTWLRRVVSGRHGCAVSRAAAL
jgi:hypothetical protein